VKVDAQLRLEGDFPVIPPIAEEELYFIIQEALNNALRHAHAMRTQVVIRSHEGQLHISIEDNGRGYDPSQLSSGMGSTTMRTRASAIGASVQGESQPGQGTKVTISLPLRPEERELP
jgi:signal transduction histidine kinase